MDGVRTKAIRHQTTVGEEDKLLSLLKTGDPLPETEVAMVVIDLGGEHALNVGKKVICLENAPKVVPKEEVAVEHVLNVGKKATCLETARKKQRRR